MSDERRAHWRAFFDNRYLGSWDLPEGRDCVVTIDRVEGHTLDLPGTSQKKKKPAVFFVGKRLPMVLNKTNAKAIARMYGDDTREWKGKLIAIFVTQTQMGDETVPCLRIRPIPPKALARANGTPEPPPVEDSHGYQDQEDAP